MKQLDYTNTNQLLRVRPLRSGSVRLLWGVDPLLALILLTELLTPFLIWKGVLPSFTRWISDAAVAVIIGLLYVRMMVFDRFPGAVWVIAGILVMGVATALVNGQSVAATVWGSWLMFRYPLVGIYAFMQSDWPKRFPQQLCMLSGAFLSLEVIVQLGQYLAGEPPGDNLAGLFGWRGTGPLVIFAFFVLCLALGHWLTTGRPRFAYGVLALGAVSSVLGEMKVYPPVALALSALAGAVFLLRGGQLRQLVPPLLVLALVVVAFALAYSVFVPGATSHTLGSYLDPQTFSDYMLYVGESSAHPGSLNIGRNYALKVGWETLKGEPLTLLFGLGLGARGESRSLNVSGIAFEQTGSNLPRRSSLLVWMQEMGLLGLLGMAVFAFWIAFTMLRDIRRMPKSQATALRYALLLFSLLWPLWSWYTTVWDQGVTMLLYWGALGYVLGESERVANGPIEVPAS